MSDVVPPKENPSGYMTCVDCGTSLFNPLKDTCPDCDEKWEREWADEEAYTDAMLQEND